MTDQPDAMTPKQQHDAANNHLERGMALAKVLQALIWQQEQVSDPMEDFTLEDLAASELRIVCNIMCDELDLAIEQFGQLAPKGE